MKYSEIVTLETEYQKQKEILISELKKYKWKHFKIKPVSIRNELIHRIKFYDEGGKVDLGHALYPHVCYSSQLKDLDLVTLYSICTILQFGILFKL